ncbi:DUF1788 domain-containing protein [Mesorhizobium sp. M7A.F.Ca.US.001.01.1.1]|nr:DUF1788 domain-containing protein [Mesorhizobium sp. M7A.F.Ca.US.001.01.1.1]
MNTFDELLAAYERQVQLPWLDDAPPAGRVWLLWFDKSMQRKFTGRIGEFEHVTMKTGRGWRHVNLAPWFGQWIARHEFFDALVDHPQEIRGLLADAEQALIAFLRSELRLCTSNDVLALDGCGSLFGIVRVSALISKIADTIPGRMLVAFPGKHAAGVYRLLDARDGWNYHAIPIPADHAL